jgi:hypothetical protein
MPSSLLGGELDAVAFRYRVEVPDLVFEKQEMKHQPA